MKILLIGDITQNKSNPFVRELFIELKKTGNQVETDLELFWNSTELFDIVHIQWPEYLFSWRCPSDDELHKLENRLQYWKKNKSTIVYTKHNDLPHYKELDNFKILYRLVESLVDGFVHLGEFSYNRSLKIYPNAKHLIIEHHVYKNTYSNPDSITKERARQILHIPSTKFVILAFGNFRDKEETENIINAFKGVKIKNKYLLAPMLVKRLIKNDSFWTNPKNSLKRKLLLLKFRLKNIKVVSQKFIQDNDLPTYFQAADIVLIQRFRILNSGNLAMSFWFNKIVVGPDVGNVKDTLVKTNNFIFNVNEIKSISRAIEESYESFKADRTVRNYNYAEENLLPEYIGRKLLHFYKSF